MIITAFELLQLLDALPLDAHVILPETIEVERPGESLGQLYRTPKGVLSYRSYA